MHDRADRGRYTSVYMRATDRLTTILVVLVFGLPACLRADEVVPEAGDAVLPVPSVSSAGSDPASTLPDVAAAAADSTVDTAVAATASAAFSATADSSGGGPIQTPAASVGFAYADRLVVDKSERHLQLLKSGQVIAEYPIRLGLNPAGHKLHEGDFRTPEGSYYLSRRNPRSEFFLSIGVSYPNDVDRRRARGNGKAPGGSIMIHGQPNVPRKPADYYARNDWTDGCIAVSNSDMVDIWLRTKVGLPIDIRP